MIAKDPIQILGVVGSPRRQGNTDILVDEVLRGAAEAGAEVEKVLLAQLDIRPCLACDACERTGKCAQRDDMDAMLEKMNRCQIWVLGTPVYWWGPTAQFKAFVDRWYGARHTIPFAGRRVILAIPMEDTDTRTARHTVGMIQDSLDYLKMVLATVIVAPGVLQRGAVQEHPDILEIAYQAGQEVVQAAAT